MEGQCETTLSCSDFIDQTEPESVQQKLSSSTECHCCSCACTEESSSKTEPLQCLASIPCKCCEASMNVDLEYKSHEISNEPTKPEDKDEQSLRPRKSKRLPLPNPDDKKPKLRTSKDVYDRLKWDPSSITIKSAVLGESLDVSSIYVGYKDRFLGMCELSLDEFEPTGSGGEIPFHRVYYFRTGGPPVEPFIGNEGEVKVREDNIPEGAVFIWDRDTRKDLIFKSGSSTVLKR